METFGFEYSELMSNKKHQTIKDEVMMKLKNKQFWAAAVLKATWWPANKFKNI